MYTKTRCDDDGKLENRRFQTPEEIDVKKQFELFIALAVSLILAVLSSQCVVQAAEVQNFGPDIDYDGSYLDYRDQARRNRADPQSDDFTSSPPPTIYRLGLSANFFELTGLQRPADIDGLIALEMSHPNDNRERVNFGVEVSYLKTLYLRGGYKLRYKNVIGYDEERWSAGFGIRLPLPGKVDFSLDYAYMDFGLIAEAASAFMASPHRFSLGLSF